jgi:hypothetical protein
MAPPNTSSFRHSPRTACRLHARSSATYYACKQTCSLMRCAFMVHRVGMAHDAKLHVYIYIYMYVYLFI